MTVTTIKVTKETRDLLKEQADAAHLTLGEYLRSLAAAADRRARFEKLGEAIRDTPAGQWESYQAETAEWEQAELVDFERGNK